MSVSENISELVSRYSMKRYRKIALLIFLISTCVQSVSIVEIASMPVKPVHMLGACLALFALLYQTKNRMNIVSICILAGLYFQTAVAYLIYGFNPLIVNMIFCTVEAIIVWRVSDDFQLDDWLWITRRASLFVFIAIVFSAVLQWNGVFSFLLNPNVGKPLYYSFFGGGPNIDASWLGLFTFFAVDSFFWPPMFMLTVMFSISVNSRAGLLSALCFSIWMAVQLFRKKKNLQTHIASWKDWTGWQRMVCFITTSVICAFFFATQIIIPIQRAREEKALSESMTQQTNSENMRQQTALENVASRFVNVGNEPGSLGRLNMWKWIPKELSENMLGYGLGNGMEQIRENDPDTIIDGNIHNIYFQVLLDQGIPGLLVVVIIVMVFLLKEIHSMAENPLAIFLISYLVLGLIQYRFLDTPMWFIVGAYLSNNAVERRSKNESRKRR